MKNAVEVRQIINENRSDIAFIIGNGVHIHNNNGDALSWEQLIIDLWNLASNSRKTKIPIGVSYTEMYDIIELTLKERTCKGRDNRFREYEKLITQTKPHKVLDYKDCEHIYEKSIAYAISSKMQDWKFKEHHKEIVSYISRINAPILTTNYDDLLAKSIDAKQYQVQKTNFSELHPWNCVFANEKVYNPLNYFGIWHINGMIKYPKSIKLGLSQYMASVDKARKMIQGKNVDFAEHFDGKNRNYWLGKNTWLHIIFNKSLFIFGLALEENEVFLRWLLIQRANYFNQFPDRKYEGWYLTTKNEMEKCPGKRFFLKSVGIEVIEVKDYKTIYEDIWI